MVEFGVKRQLVQFPDETIIELHPIDGGMDVENTAKELSNTNPVRSPLSINTQMSAGSVVEKAPGLAQLGTQSGAASKEIMALGEFEKLDGTVLLVRVLPKTVERWDGATWLQLTGTLTGSADRYPSVLTASDLFLIANGFDKVQSWDGNDGNAVQDLSASAPVGHLLAIALDRLIVADIVDATRDRERIMISKGGDITDFSDPTDGDDLILPEDSSERPSPIMGMSQLFARFTVYRRHSIWVGTPTGDPAAPFAFSEASAGVGVLSEKSIAFINGLGDAFLSDEGMVYFFGGGSRPIPVGAPVQRDIRDSVTDFSRVYGAVNQDKLEYWLIAPTEDASFPNMAWIWSAKHFLTEQRIVWYKREFPTEMISMTFGDAPTTSEFIDDEQRFIDQISELINDWQAATTIRTLHLGDSSGRNFHVSELQRFDDVGATFIATHLLPLLGTPQEEVLIDTVTIEHQSNASSSVQFSLSKDGGVTFTAFENVSLDPAPAGGKVHFYVGEVVEEFQPRLRFMADSNPRVTGIKIKLIRRGLGR